MVYEVRKWFDDSDCLYTDDSRVKDLALGSADLHIVATYFRTTKAQQPFAWDIVGKRDLVKEIAARFQSSRARASIRAR